jgi:ribosomal protein L34E
MTIGGLEAQIRRLKADLNNIQRGRPVDEKKVELLEKELVETVSKYTSKVRDFRRQNSDMQKCHELEKKALCAEKDKEIDKLEAKIRNINRARGAIVDERVVELEKKLADEEREHANTTRSHRRELAELQSKHLAEIGRMLADREERTKVLNQTCDELRGSLETSRIEVVRLQVLQKELDFQNRLLTLNLGKRASECAPEYYASAMTWTSDEGEKACQTPKVTTKFRARKIAAELYKEAEGNKEYAIELLRAMTRNKVTGELFSELGWKGQGRDPAEAQKQVCCRGICAAGARARSPL